MVVHQQEAVETGQAGRRTALRWVPLAVIIAGLVAAFALGLDQYLSLEVLARERAALVAFIAEHRTTAVLAYLGVYAVAVALSIPGGLVLTLAGGFLFGVAIGATLAVVGATVGATLLFLAARTSLGETLRRRAGPWLGRLADGFRADGFSYLLTLRLIPVVPFWLVNLVPAILGMRLLPYVAATLLGIIPATVVFAGVGHGLGATLDAGADPDLGILLRPAILLPLLGLALLSLAPVAYRRWRRRA